VWVLLLLLGSVLTVAEEKTEKQEAKSLPTSPPTEEQQASKPRRQRSRSRGNAVHIERKKIWDHSRRIVKEERVR
jgi:hypothetical protein